MSTAPLFAVELPTSGRLELMIIKLLAVAGGAFLGGLGAGLILQVLSRLIAARKVPRVPLQIVRLLGAVALGWIVFLFMFGAGGGGFGGPGGWGWGGGGGNGPGTAPAVTRREQVGGATDTGTRPAEGKTLQVEVLAEYPVKYRVVGRDDKLSLEELKKFLASQRDATPPLREVQIVLDPQHGPDKLTVPVQGLIAWAKDNGLRVVDLPGPK